MKLSVMLNYSGDVMAAADEAIELEQAGLDCVWVAEAYSFDAVSMMGYLAGRSNRLEIGSAIVNIYSRTPTLLAMTAAGLDVVSGGRINLGLGASGPQVIEGFHGVPYEKPLARTKEVIDVCRRVWKREVIEHHGATIDIPLPEGHGTGLAKPLKLINTPVRDVDPDLDRQPAEQERRSDRRARGWLDPELLHTGAGRPRLGRRTRCGQDQTRPVARAAPNHRGRTCDVHR